MWGQLADDALQTIAKRYRLDFGLETELRIHVKDLLIANVYLLRVVDDEKLSFTQMELLDLIDNQCCLTTTTLGRQPIVSQCFQPLALQSLALWAAAIDCVLSEYATGKNVTVMLSQDEDQGKFCHSMVMDCMAAEATALINYTLAGCFILPPPPSCPTAMIGTPQSPSLLRSLDLHCSI